MALRCPPRHPSTAPTSARLGAPRLPLARSALTLAALPALASLVAAQVGGCGAAEPAVAVPGAPSASAATPASASRPTLTPGAFVRTCVTPHETHTDACACLGGYGAACGDAFAAEKDAVVRRWLLRMVDAQARLTLEELREDPSAGVPVPHAEIGAFCKESGPCGGKTADGNELDGGYACLTAGTAEWTPGQTLADNERLARACRCGPAEARVPVMGGMGVVACSEEGAPMTFGAVDAATAREIRACAECDAELGRKGCEAELTRLAPSDPELARYVAEAHARHCQRQARPPVEPE